MTSKYKMTMKCSLFCALIFALLAVCGRQVVGNVDPGRSAFIKEALGWMTFRKDAVLMTDTQVNSLFYQPVINKYRTSKMYRTFVIAFQVAVLPRLTLKEGDACDPAYVKEYKDPYNNSVTWHFQKKFTFDIYDKKDSSSRQYCDYRQGLICHPTSSKCQCPDGSSMQGISLGSPKRFVERCLLQKDEICSLIDMDHGNDPQHSALASNLYHIIFNLEKPLGCAEGTQCRFKQGDLHFPHCYYDFNGRPWHPPPPSPGSPPTTWKLSIGDECALGLYAKPGSCEAPAYVPGASHTHPGFICFHFGPPKSTASTAPVPYRQGVCMPEHTPFGLSGFETVPDEEEDYKDFDFVKLTPISFVHPGTVPLRGTELANYYERFLDSAETSLGSSLITTEGTPCSVSDSSQLEEIWSYFASLEEDPPAGQDYAVGATKAELNAKLEELDKLAEPNGLNHACQVYWTYNLLDREDVPGLQCVATGVNDHGYDGKCQKPGNLDSKSRPHSEKFTQLIKQIETIEYERNYENSNYNADILDKYPEPNCKPFPRGRSLTGRDLTDSLEDGSCPPFSVCYQDFGNAKLFDDSCNLVGDVREQLVCHPTAGSEVKLGGCEKTHLENKISELLEGSVEDYADMGKGEGCNPDFEKAIRTKDMEGLGKFNQYQVISWIEHGTLCDTKGKKVECDEHSRTCQTLSEGGQGKSEATTRLVTKLLPLTCFMMTTRLVL